MEAIHACSLEVHLGGSTFMPVAKFFVALIKGLVKYSKETSNNETAGQVFQLLTEITLYLNGSNNLECIIKANL